MTEPFVPILTTRYGLADSHTMPVALKAGARKAVDAYGTSIGTSLDKAVAHLRDRPQRLDACIRALKIDAPRATVWQRIRDLSARSAKVEGLGQNWR